MAVIDTSVVVAFMREAAFTLLPAEE